MAPAAHAGVAPPWNCCIKPSSCCATIACADGLPCAAAASVCAVTAAAFAASTPVPLISSPCWICLCTGLLIKIALPCAACTLPTELCVCCAAVICKFGSFGSDCAACVAETTASTLAAAVSAWNVLAPVCVGIVAVVVPAVDVGTCTLPVSVPVPCAISWLESVGVNTA